MKMENGERVDSKVEKDFELRIKARNMRLHLKGDTLYYNTTSRILKTLMSECYYEDRQVKNLALSHEAGHHKGLRLHYAHNARNPQ